MTDLTPAEIPACDWTPEQVIAWLRTPPGELWSQERIGDWLEAHWDDSGAFADVICDDKLHARKAARWPEPLEGWSLDGE